MIGFKEWVIIAIVVLLLFGASAIPKIARSIGRAKGELEKGIQEGKEAAKEGETAGKDKKEKKD
jgi:sec-independent protein translocase protein TatA